MISYHFSFTHYFIKNIVPMYSLSARMPLHCLYYNDGMNMQQFVDVCEWIYQNHACQPEQIKRRFSQHYPYWHLFAFIYFSKKNKSELQRKQKPEWVIANDSKGRHGILIVDIHRFFKSHKKFAYCCWT